MTVRGRHMDKCPQSRIAPNSVSPTRLSGWLAVARQCRLWCAMRRPLMRGALMSARNDMEAAEPTLGQLRERVELRRAHPVDSFEVRLLSDAGLRSSGWVA
jgi:hypothetical protein